MKPKFYVIVTKFTEVQGATHRAGRLCQVSLELEVDQNRSEIMEENLVHCGNSANGCLKYRSLTKWIARASFLSRIFNDHRSSCLKRKKVGQELERERERNFSSVCN